MQHFLPQKHGSFQVIAHDLQKGDNKDDNDDDDDDDDVQQNI
jgi:hypothetical protein